MGHINYFLSIFIYLLSIFLDIYISELKHKKKLYIYHEEHDNRPIDVALTNFELD